MSWLNRLKDHLAHTPEPKPQPQAHEQVTSKTISTTQLGEIAGIHLPSQLLKNLGIRPFAQTKTGCFWATEDVPIILLTLSKYFADKAKEEIKKL